MWINFAHFSAASHLEPVAPTEAEEPPAGMWYPAIITMPHEDDLENVCFQCPKLALIHRGWRAHRSRVIVAGWAPPGMFFPFGQALTSHDSGPTAREARAEVSDTERRTMQRLQLLESRIVLLERRSIEMRSIVNWSIVKRSIEGRSM